MDKLHWKSAAAIARLIREKKLSASEVLEHFLARVDRSIRSSTPSFGRIVSARDNVQRLPMRLSPGARFGDRCTVSP